MKKSPKKPTDSIKGPPKSKKKKRTMQSSARAQAGSFPGYGGYSY